MSILMSAFLRKALIADAAISGAAALLMALGAPMLAPLLDLPANQLRWAGIALLPFVALLGVAARQNAVARHLVMAIIAINCLWVVGSILLLAAGPVSPNALGTAFVIAQALTVALLAELQLIGLRRSATAST